MSTLRIYWSLIFSFVALTLASQGDSLNTLPAKNKKWEYDSQFDQRNSVIAGPHNSSSSLPIYGYNFGWVYKERFRFGVGVYYAKSQDSKAYFVKYDPVLQKYAPNAIILTNPKGRDYLLQKSVEMYYITPSFEWNFFTSKWIELGIPIEVGIGYSKLLLNEYFSGASMPVFSYKTGKILSGQTVFFPAMVGLDMMINLTPEVGFQLGAGYRYVLQEVGISENYNGWFYQVGLQLFPQNIIQNFKKDFREWKTKRKERKALRHAKKTGSS